MFAGQSSTAWGGLAAIKGFQPGVNAFVPRVWLGDDGSVRIAYPLQFQLTPDAPPA